MTRSFGAAALALAVTGARCNAAPRPQYTWGVAVLEAGTSPDARQEQLAVRDCLELMGIPFVATTNVQEAVRRPLVLLSGVLTNRELTPGDREVLYAYVERGGVLLATQVQGNTFFPLFGITAAATSRTNFRVTFTASLSLIHI